MGPPRKIGKILTFFGFFRPTQKMGPDGPKWGQEDFFPTNPDLADILGRTDFDFENFYFLDFLGPQLGPGLGLAWKDSTDGQGPGQDQAGNLEIWELEIWKFEIQKNPKNKNSQNQNTFCPKCRQGF